MDTTKQIEAIKSILEQAEKQPGLVELMKVYEKEYLPTLKLYNTYVLNTRPQTVFHTISNCSHPK